ncbi:MAG: hypothetical protein HY291_15380 [Planctomycetes bacterium]|nr:hypothetical protein [Planctomycetota bacterium]
MKDTGALRLLVSLFVSLLSWYGLAFQYGLYEADLRQAETGIPPRQLSPGTYLVFGFGTFVSVIQLAHPQLAFVFAGCLGVSLLVFKRVPSGSNTFWQPTGHRWTVQFGLLQLLLASVVVATAMLLYFNLNFSTAHEP